MAPVNRDGQCKPKTWTWTCHHMFYLQIHNNRLSRARRLIENSFGILANTWRILTRRIDLEPDKVCLITVTTCILHNILRENRDPPVGATLERIVVDDGEGFGAVEHRAIRGTQSAMAIRNQFKLYVNTHAILYV